MHDLLRQQYQHRTDIDLSTLPHACHHDVVVCQIRGPQYRPQHTMALIVQTQGKVSLFFRRPLYVATPATQ